MQNTIWNFGSLNLDKVYDVKALVREGETIGADAYAVHVGGKGLNQSIAIARAGGTVRHVGAVGFDGDPLIRVLEAESVDTSRIMKKSCASGHAIIQVDVNGKNGIIVEGGANRRWCEKDVHAAMEDVKKDDTVLLQNETNAVGEMIHAGKARGAMVVLNPSPADPSILEAPLHKVDLLAVNESEAAFLCQEQGTADFLVQRLRKKFSNTAILCTFGAEGARFCHNGTDVFQKAFFVTPKDTTAAGDTFLGCFLAQRQKKETIEYALEFAAAAAALCVTKKGAADSIPNRENICAWIAQKKGGASL